MTSPIPNIQRFVEPDTDPHVALLTRIGDDALVLGQRLTAWCGHAPSLELDIAVSNLALDAIGQARMWLTLAGEVEGRGRKEDDFAYWREPQAYTNLQLVEQPNGDFAVTIVRQFMFSVYQRLIYKGLEASTDSRVAEIAQGGGMEVDYHVRFATDWMHRLGLGTDESHRRMQTAVTSLWRFSAELFDRDEVVDACTESGFAPIPTSLEDDWSAIVKPVMATCELELPDIGTAASFKGGRKGLHTEHLAPMLAELQSVARQFPGASW